MTDEIKKKIITITAAEAINRKADGVMLGLNIFEDEEKKIKYALWFAKQDQKSTKANTQYKTNNYGIGSQVGIAYKEEEREYTYKDQVTGEDKQGKGMNRTILWFAEAGEMEQYNTVESPKSQGDMVIDELNKKVEALDDIKVEDIPF